MPTEKQLLNTIFDSASSDNERAAAVELVKKITGKDRGDLVEKYTNDADDGAAETYRWFWELEKNRRIGAEVARDVAKIDLSDAQKHLRKFEEHTRKLASVLMETKWLDAKACADLQAYTEIRPSTEVETERLIYALWVMTFTTVRFTVSFANTSRFGQAPTQPVAEPPSPKPEPTAASSTGPSRTWINYETPAPHTLKIAGNGKTHKAPYPVKPIEEACAAYGLVLTPTQSPPELPKDYPIWKRHRGEKLFTTACPVCVGVMHVSTHYQRWTCQCDRSFPNRKHYAPDVMGLVEHLTGCSHLQALWWVIGTGSQPSRKEQPQSPPPPKAKRRGARRKPAAGAPAEPVSTGRTFGDFNRAYSKQRTKDGAEPECPF